MQRARVCENVTVHNFFLTSKDLNKKSRQKCATSRGLNPGEKFDQKAVITCPARLASLWLDFVISGLKCTYNGRWGREWERESIGTEFYYIWMTAKKKKGKSLPANYISVWMIFLPPPLLICFGPLWVFCFARIRLPFSFYSISRIQEERKKERNGLAAILPKFQGSVYGLEGVGGMGVGPTHGTF